MTAEAARALFEAAGVTDPPSVWLEAIAVLEPADRPAFAHQMRRVQRRRTPFGCLELLLEDLVAEELADLKRSRKEPT